MAGGGSRRRTCGTGGHRLDGARHHRVRRRRDQGVRFHCRPGWMDCRPGERGGRASVEFSWLGDEVSGQGWAVLADDGSLQGHLYFHLGGDSGFRAVRVGQESEIASLSPAASMSRRQPEHGTGGPVRTGRHRSSGSHATTTIEVQSRSPAARGEPQHFLNFLPLPQGQAALRPTLAARTDPAGASAVTARMVSGSWSRGSPSPPKLTVTASRTTAASSS